MAGILLHALDDRQNLVCPVDTVSPSAGDLTQQASLNELIDQALSAREIDARRSLHLASSEHRLGKEQVNGAQQPGRSAPGLEACLAGGRLCLK